VQVTVRLFAAARELVGSGSLAQDLPDSATLGDLAEALYRTYPGLRPMRLRLALNSAYAAPEAALHAGDEVALIPPVGGG
jgi:molybdopterin converting factor subunit 1